MKIRLASDIHLEFHAVLTDELYLRTVPELPDDKETTLILCGDVSVGYNGFSPFEFWEHLSKRFARVLTIMGNHEAYGYVWEDVEERYISETGYHSNIYFMSRKATPFGLEFEGVSFWGDTFWTSMDHMNQEGIYDHVISRQLNDFARIKRRNSASCKDVRFSPSCWRYWNKLAKESLVKFLEENKDKPKVVLTHHSPDIICDRHGGNEVTQLYYNYELRPLLDKHKPKLWCFGHTHKSTDDVIQDTRVVSNQVGYHGHNQDTGYNPSLVLEVI